jgi:hypothetical protein
MAWTALRTWTTGELVTAAMMNQQIRDNLAYLGDLAYVEFTSSASITATTEGTAQQIVTAPAITYAATPIIIEFFSPGISPDPGIAGRTLILVLEDVTTPLGQIAAAQAPATTAAPIQTVYAVRKLTPTAASHTYNVRGYVSAGTGTVRAGAGGAGAYLPGFIRVTGLVS